MKNSEPEKKVLAGLPLPELIELLAPLPAFRAKQIFKWISRGALAFGEMTDLDKNLREDLDSRFSVRSSSVGAQLEDPGHNGKAGDGTVKLQISLYGGTKIEAVLLSDAEERKTACISTQAGCPAGCVFCKTGSLGFSRNLNSAEIVEQFLHLKALAAAANTDISNIVIMGMGEPLLNLSELRRALAFLCDAEGLGISRRRITVSTCGVIEGIRDLADKGPHIRLACSLTSARQELRNRLMPIGKANPLPLLKKALAAYRQKSGQRITLEAVLLGGINTTPADAEAMIDFARGLDAVINLIPWNPVEGMGFEGEPLREPSRAEVETFTAMLEKGGLKVTRRYRKGRGVAGACGQLGVLPENPGQGRLKHPDAKAEDSPENVYPL
ncbi:putative dual-specificity RNA methyltransferase RlmN [Spirochaetia bacterium]|nr:putative dual-specificity RNA methyltransferase RlmN [Spirochaetia bacterium]